MKEENKVYKKVNGKYEEVGFDWSGFPQDGVWLVKDGSNNCIMKMDDVGKKPIPYIDVMKHFNDIINRIMDKDSLSISDVVKETIEYLSERMEHEKYI